MTLTPRWSLPYPALTDQADVPNWMSQLALALDDVAKDAQGTLAARPVSTAGSPGKAGRFYTATDQNPHQTFRDYGTGWDRIGGTDTRVDFIDTIKTGYVSAAGAVLAGTGYGVGHPSGGVYVVSFSTSYAVIPIIVVTPEVPTTDPVMMTLQNVSVNSFQVTAWHSGDWSQGNNLIDVAFRFVSMAAK